VSLSSMFWVEELPMSKVWRFCLWP